MSTHDDLRFAGHPYPGVAALVAAAEAAAETSTDTAEEDR